MCRCPDKEASAVGCNGFEKGRARPKKYSREVIRLDMTQLQLTEDMTLIEGCRGRKLE